MANKGYDSKLDYMDDWGFNEAGTTWNPQQADSTTFKIRNDPQELLERFKLQLMNAFRVEMIEKDEKGKERKVYKVKFKKNTKPLANKQGVEEIISYMEKFINNHVVQGNIDSLEEYRIRLQYISDDVAAHFLTKRKEWDVDISDIDIIIATTVNIIDLFLTRTLFNEERKGYGESYKETTTRDIKQAGKPNIFQKLGGFLAGGK